jgi:hypothetical protein
MYAARVTGAHAACVARSENTALKSFSNIVTLAFECSIRKGTMSIDSLQLARPIAPHRLRIYFGVLFFVGTVFTFMTVAEAFGWLPPSPTVDVVANVLFGVPVAFVPFVFFWKAPGEQRTPAQRASEVTLVFLPYVFGSQLGYELPFLIGHPFGLWNSADLQPGWRWLWWQYGLADHRYVSANASIFGLEFWSVLAGIVLATAWAQLLRVNLSDRDRIKWLWFALLGTASSLGTAAAYVVSEFRSGFSDLGQGAFGLWFKFVGENIFYFIFPYFALYAMYLQIDRLTRQTAIQEALGTQTLGTQTADSHRTGIVQSHRSVAPV